MAGAAPDMTRSHLHKSGYGRQLEVADCLSQQVDCRRDGPEGSILAVSDHLVFHG
jgi:hypothetical protein